MCKAGEMITGIMINSNTLIIDIACAVYLSSWPHDIADKDCLNTCLTVFENNNTFLFLFCDVE